MQDSSIDYQVSGAAGASSTFYVHISDWRGDSRPDMAYTLNVSGVVDPLIIQSTPLLSATRGFAYSQQLQSSNGTLPISWTMTSGNLPPGLSLSSSGAITGTATTDGTYPFTIQATDSSPTPQIVTAQKSIQVGEPVSITSSATLPAACLNQPYSFTIQTAGGVPPLAWTFWSNGWPSGLPLNQTNGSFTGTPGITGSFTGTVGVNDTTGNGVSQAVSLTVNQCP